MTADQILAREHREALTRMDPAQVRALKRIAKAAADQDRGKEEALAHQLAADAAHQSGAQHIPDWMLG